MVAARRRTSTPLIQFMFWIVVVLVFSQLQLRSTSDRNSDERDDLQQIAPPSSRDLFYMKPQIQHQSQHSRFFLGIFTKVHQRTMRSLTRELFSLHNDTRVCPFGSVDGRMPPPPPDHCQLMYTFVIGGGNAKASTQIIKPKRKEVNLVKTPPLLIKAGTRYNTTLESNNDVTFLNILVRRDQGCFKSSD